MKNSDIASEVICALKSRTMTLATAESCTGGGLGFCLTAVSGSSAVYLGGVVSYANRIKENVLHVSEEVLKMHGAVSESTAKAMAEGVRALMEADIALSITGIAGPASDDTLKPVGLVYIGLSTKNGTVIKENHFTGDREQVRAQSICTALSMILENI